MFHSFINKSYLNKNMILSNNNYNFLKTDFNLSKNINMKPIGNNYNFLKTDFTFPKNINKGIQCDYNNLNPKKETVDVGIQCNINNYEDFEIIDKSGIPKSSFLAVGNYLYNNEK